MKAITSSSIDKIGDRIKEAEKQGSEIIVLNLVGDKKEYSLSEAVKKVHETIKDFDNTKLKEVWLIMDGKISKIKNKRLLI